MLYLTPMVARDKAWFVAWFVELPRVVAVGMTEDEAIDHLYDVLALMLEHDHELLEQERQRRLQR